MLVKNVNIDFCGIMKLLQLLEQHGFTRDELDKISRRIAAQTGANILLIS